MLISIQFLRYTCQFQYTFWEGNVNFNTASWSKANMKNNPSLSDVNCNIIWVYMRASIKMTNEIYILQKIPPTNNYHRKILQHKLNDTKLFFLANQAAHNVSGPWVQGLPTLGAQTGGLGVPLPPPIITQQHALLRLLQIDTMCWWQIK